MNKIKNFILKKYNSLLIILLALLGFSTACEQGGYEYGTPAVEYGVPNATFIVRGKIESKTTSVPIQGIRVIMVNDTAYSGQNGEYLVEGEGFPGDKSFTMSFEDTDGALNGEFHKADTTVEFQNPNFTDGDGSWYLGKTEKEVNIKLDPKE
jgi:putative lipoprotein (rSAM/lipoprotein system)